jgi:hypothetical protein
MGTLHPQIARTSPHDPVCADLEHANDLAFSEDDATAHFLC